MAEILRFPNKIADNASFLVECDELVASPDIARKIEGACRALLGAICRDVVHPDKFFIAYKEEEKIAYLCFDFNPKELVETVHTILEHEGKKS